MHEAIAQGQLQGRVSLAERRALPHLFGVGALEGSVGELTLVHGGRATGAQLTAHVEGLVLAPGAVLRFQAE